MNTWHRRVTATLLALLMLPAASAAAGEPSMDEFVQSYVDAHMSESRVPGVVFAHVDRHGTTVKTFGSADLDTGRPMTPSTPLRVGSISKPITAAIALELAAEGQLDLDAPVDEYLDVDLSDQYGSASTIRQLLQHRGGYSDAIVGSHHPEAQESVDLDEWITRVPNRSTPHGVVASYTSVGYTLVGAAVAGVTGESFAEAARHVLFDPLGMTDATFTQPAPVDVATGYGLEDGRLTPYPLDATDLVPGAGLTAPGEDIGAFLSALVDEDTPLAEETVDGLLRPAGPAPGLRGFTTGLAQWRYDERSVLYHGGNGIGTTNRMMVLPDEGVAIFTAVNGEALTGIGDPSTQSMFVNELHRQIVERFYPASKMSDDTPTLDGQGLPAHPAAGAYVSTRVDTASPLRLEALVTQSHVAHTESGIAFGGRDYTDDGTGTYRSDTRAVRFLEGPDGVTYATTGGTGSYRKAEWWETLAPNVAILGGSLLVMVVGLAVGIRSASDRVRGLMIGSTILALAFVGLLAYGLSTVKVMELFTGLPTVIRASQVAVLGLGAASLLGPVALLARRAELSRRVLGSALAISMAGLALTSWALMWRGLPI